MGRIDWMESMTHFQCTGSLLDERRWQRVQLESMTNLMHARLWMKSVFGDVGVMCEWDVKAYLSKGVGGLKQELTVVM